MEQHCENCPFKEQLTKLEQDFGELQQNLQLSAVYGKSLLDENNALKRQIKELQSADEVYPSYYKTSFGNCFIQHLISLF